MFWSERDGWGHYYLYDANTGTLKNRDHRRASSSRRRSTASTTRRGRCSSPPVGREKGEDPYFTHLYRVGSTAAASSCSTPATRRTPSTMADDDHATSSTTRRASNAAPESVLYDALGNAGHEARDDRTSAR